MKKAVIIFGLVAALAIPATAAAARHRSSHKAKSNSTATAPKAKAKGAGSRYGVAVTTKSSKNAPASSKTKATANPKASTSSGGKPNAKASGGKASTSVNVKPNGQPATPGARVTVTPRGGSTASGNQGTGGATAPSAGCGVSRQFDRLGRRVLVEPGHARPLRGEPMVDRCRPVAEPRSRHAANLRIGHSTTTSQDHLWLAEFPGRSF
jgi:hypothetical protein